MKRKLLLIISCLLMVPFLLAMKTLDMQSFNATVAAPNPTSYMDYQGKGCWLLQAEANGTAGADPILTVYGSSDASDGCEKNCTDAQYAAKAWVEMEAITIDEVDESVIKTKQAGVYQFYRFIITGNTNPRVISFTVHGYCEVTGFSGG